MRKSLLSLSALTLSTLLSAPAHAWVPKLDEATAKAVIGGAYGRQDLPTTYLTLDLGVKEGKLVAGEEALRVFDGPAQCLSDWLAAPGDFSKGSRLQAVTATGQADQLYFQATDAHNRFKNLSTAEALGPELSAARLPDGELRLDIVVAGLPSEKARSAYTVRLKAPDGKIVAPVRASYVDDWKPAVAATATAAAQGPYSGTLVYYFRPLDAGLGAGDRAEFLIRTEADSDCAYSVSINLAAFQ